ncbi:Uncharacterised protein [Amycolatopsis camponoti]|uniref:Uncharacterized protein n=1 Tax=Amycolatopsis camponoti TaxID=2606593 RepID=A0A6I8LU20_9PSEU|nr:hypothetical protein [Amycolatopsis camponoti]VVJ20531.1 Uncharacterised protein [Amycolatopsis camponoti]
MKPWLQALFQAAAARGATGVIVLVLIVALTCVLSGTPPATIYAIAVLLMAATLLIVAVLGAFQYSRATDPEDKLGSRQDEEPPAE